MGTTLELKLPKYSICKVFGPTNHSGYRVLGTRDVNYWVLGPSGLQTSGCEATKRNRGVHVGAMLAWYPWSNALDQTESHLIREVIFILSVSACLWPWGLRSSTADSSSESHEKPA